MSNEQQQPKEDGSHISPAIRADLGKLTPELAAGIRRVADADKPPPAQRAR